MAKTKISKGERQGLALACYVAFHNITNVAFGVKRDMFLRALTDNEIKELEHLQAMTKKLGELWRSFAWKLQGYDKKKGPPTRGK
jgi:hypothetical protein